LGFGFLILPYILGGMGAGDVKALAALGAWLGPFGTLYLFCYMAIAGGVMSLGVLIWKGLLWQKLLNMVLSRDKVSTLLPAQKTPGIPYGVAMALGMLALMMTGGV
jgi:prepilin peptidase CpaA